MIMMVVVVVFVVMIMVVIPLLDWSPPLFLRLRNRCCGYRSTITSIFICSSRSVSYIDGSNVPQIPLVEILVVFFLL